MLTSEQIKAVRKIQIRTSHLVSDLFAGQYQSVFKGRGMEFAEVRQYLPGDDVRTIDWNVTARTGVPHVKRFAEERELTVMLLVDASASTHFGTREAAEERDGRRARPRCSRSRRSPTTTRSAWSCSPTGSSWRCRRRRARATCCASSARSCRFTPQGRGTDIAGGARASQPRQQAALRRPSCISDFLDTRAARWR